MRPEFIFLPWIDLIWIPIMAFVAGPKHRMLAVLFALSCSAALHLQSELMHSFGKPSGLLPVFEGDVLFRGVLIYAVFCVLYTGVLVKWRTREWALILPLTLALFGGAFVVSSCFMLV